MHEFFFSLFKFNASPPSIDVPNRSLLGVFFCDSQTDKMISSKFLNQEIRRKLNKVTSTFPEVVIKL